MKAISERSSTDTNSACFLSDRKPGDEEDKKKIMETKGSTGNGREG